MVLNSELNDGNRLNVIDSFAPPTTTVASISLKAIFHVKYGLKILKIFTRYRMHHPKLDVNKVSLLREIGGRGSLQLK